MKYSSNLDQLGIYLTYEDINGQVKTPSPTTIECIRTIMTASSVTPRYADVKIVPEGTTVKMPKSGKLHLEDGTCLKIAGELPAHLPIGYYDFRPDHEDITIRIIVFPQHCWFPAQLKAWGWATQLYAVRSARSWGLGDFADLRQLANWSHQQGARFLLINPASAVTPMIPQESSPYYPSSRCFLNPIYLRIDEVPGARESQLDLDRFEAMGRELNHRSIIDRDAIFLLKEQALNLLWSRFAGDDDFEHFRKQRGEPLYQFATYCTLAEKYGKEWPRWSPELRHPHGHGIVHFARENNGRIVYHEWLQWLAHRQLSEATREIAVIQDLPIGFDPNGADAWMWQDLLAPEMKIGAPPDMYNSQGQDWGMPPFVPQRLRGAGYEPFIQTLRSVLQWGGGLRIDHVMGLFRLFWIPQGMRPADGTYVSYPADELLAILAVESHRAQAVIVGEDLGTVEPGVREAMAERHVLSYRVMWFEEKPPSQYPHLALASISTHDLPTIAGFWSGHDITRQRQLHLEPNEPELNVIRERLRKYLEIDKEIPIEEVIAKSYQLLAKAPSVLIAAALEDVLAVEERPNMPGAGSESHNWSMALPHFLDAIFASPLAKVISQSLSRTD